MEVNHRNEVLVDLEESCFTDEKLEKCLFENKEDVDQSEIEENNETHKGWTLDDFEIGNPLGKGNFGNVFVTREKHCKQIVALKVMFKSQIIDLDVGYQLKREIQIQHDLKHPNILKLLGLFHDERRVFIILEYACRGELFTLLQSQPGHMLREPVAAKFIRQLCSALMYCHMKGVIHRDIKPENLLLDNELNLKVADFGWSVVADHSKRNTICGTLDYVAPEMVMNQPHDYAVDIWAVGILLYEMLTGYTPFLNTQKMLEYIQTSQFSIPNSISETASNLISAIIKINPDERLSLDKISKHAWLSEMQIFEYQEVKMLIEKLNQNKMKMNENREI